MQLVYRCAGPQQSSNVVLTLVCQFTRMHTPSPPLTPSVFFTVALAARGDDLLLREIEWLRQAVRITRAERPFAIEAWVVLPDHLHAIWTLPPGDNDFSTRWRLIKSRFTTGLRKGALQAAQPALQNRAVWQPRLYDHPIQTPEDHAAHLRFCWTDPVKHGLVDDPADWPYSSFNKLLPLRSVDRPVSSQLIA